MADNKHNAYVHHINTRRSKLLRMGERVAAGRIPSRVDFEDGYDYGFKDACEIIAGYVDAVTVNLNDQSDIDFLRSTMEDALDHISPETGVKWQQVKAHFMLLAAAKNALKLIDTRSTKYESTHDALKAAIELSEKSE